MKTGIVIFMTLHGLIHLMGFLKGFNLAKIEQLKVPISKPAGMVWLISFVLFAATVNLYLADISYYLGTGFTGILLSQVLIIQSWKDAKFGTLPNILFGVLLLISIS
jgi:hypothetical protein